MVDTGGAFGADLRLLDDLLYQEQRERGDDLVTADKAGPARTDLERVTGVPNLQQALLLRFLTPAGELADLGHPDYGSRLDELIGEPNTPATRGRAKVYALQALAAEPRVSEVRSVTVTTSPLGRNRIDIRADLVAVDAATPISLVFPFFLEGASP